MYFLFPSLFQLYESLLFPKRSANCFFSRAVTSAVRAFFMVLVDAYLLNKNVPVKVGKNGLYEREKGLDDNEMTYIYLSLLRACSVS